MTLEELKLKLDSEFLTKNNIYNSRMLGYRKELKDSIIEHTKFLDILKPSLAQRLWHIKHSKYDFQSCIGGNEVTTFHSSKDGYKKLCLVKTCKCHSDLDFRRKSTMVDRYGCEYPLQSDKIKDKQKATNLEKYGVEHVTQSKIVQDKTKATNLEKYGVECVLQSETIKDKIKVTNLERYGVEYGLQSEIVKDKSKATCLEKYGVENAAQSDGVKDKMKATCLERYNVEYALQSDKVKDKIKLTNLERYGAEYPLQSELVKDKWKATNLEKYGFEYGLQSEVIKDKTRATNLEKYGFEYITQVEFIRDKIKATNLVNYGFEYVSQSQIVKDKVKATNLERYGVEYPIQSDIIMSKIKSTNMERYGFEYALQSEIIKDKFKITNLERYGFEYAIQSKIIKDKAKKTNMERYGVEYSTQSHLLDNIHLMKSQEFWDEFKDYNEIVDYFRDIVVFTTMRYYTRKYRPDLVNDGLISYPHRIINNFLTELNIEFVINTKEIITPKELDIFIVNHKLAIEVNGIYWHSEKQGRDNNYHLNKVNQCELKDITLLQFTDYDILNKTNIVFSMIKAELSLNEIINTTDTQIVDIDDILAETFYNDNCLQGYIEAEIHKGLTYNNELVAVISLTKLSNENYFINYANKLNYNVIDSFQKLVKNSGCIGKLIYHVDRNYSSGKFYEDNNWHLESIIPPNYYYTNDYENLYHQTTIQKDKLEELLETYDDNLSELENMVANGYDVFWDCGTKVYSYNNISKNNLNYNH